MKFDIWETAPSLYPHARRKWDRLIFKWLNAKLPGHDETDILGVMDEVYADLEKVEEREGISERSRAALVRKVSCRRAAKKKRQWEAEGYRTPLQPLGKRRPAGKDNIASIQPAPKIGTADGGSDDEAADELNENSWGDSWSGDPARIYEKAHEPPVPVTREELAKKYPLTVEEVDLLLSDGPKSGRDRVRLCRLRERMKKKLLGENENK